jgi:Na+(H+)/acetate symporter ActP
MREFTDTNTADIRYVIGLPLLIAVIAFVPLLIFYERIGGIPATTFISPAVAPLITFFFVYMFAKMSTTVADGKIQIVFHYGFPKKEISLPDIQSVELQEVSNWWGSGIKRMRGAVMWRSWGKTVVVVEKRDGMRMFIGSDNPHELQQAILSSLKDQS